MNLVFDLKDRGEDFEFYPTTNEIIAKLISSMREYESFLDIGAGNGKVLLAVQRAGKSGKLYAIEKSPKLCAELPKDVMIVGTDFHQQSLLSKKVEAIFCNPPYSEFITWVERIIRTGYCKVAYFVIPERWKASEQIKEALRFRGANAYALGSFSFIDAEDRQARARVDLVQVLFPDKDDPFDLSFKEMFSDFVSAFEAPKDEQATSSKERFDGLVTGPTLPDQMVAMYNAEMEKIRSNYVAASKLDPDVLREFDICPKKVCDCLKARMEGLKYDYWNELFGRLTAITDRLTSKGRRKLLDNLGLHRNVDFTVSNIFEIILWVIKNANVSMDEQLIETYEVMVDKCNVALYKSNRRVWVEDRWRSQREQIEENSHFKLEYRIVTHRIGGVSPTWSRTELSERGAEFIGDLLTIARNLGFQTVTNDSRLTYDGRKGWQPGEPQEFHWVKDGVQRVLLEVKGFKNGNMHLRFDPKFMLALNVEHGRLKGWIRSPREAAEEIQEPAAAECFNVNHKIAITNPGRLLG